MGTVRLSEMAMFRCWITTNILGSVRSCLYGDVFTSVVDEIAVRPGYHFNQMFDRHTQFMNIPGDVQLPLQIKI